MNLRRRNLLVEPDVAIQLYARFNGYVEGQIFYGVYVRTNSGIVPLWGLLRRWER